MKIHFIKEWPPDFAQLHPVEDQRRFEIRKNDRGFSKGDVLCIQEWCPMEEIYTGRATLRKIQRTHVPIHLTPGMVILQIGELTPQETEAALRQIESDKNGAELFDCAKASSAEDAIKGR